MSLTVTIADNENNTGATATVSGADIGATATVNVQQLKDFGGAGFSSAGSRTGDGTVALSALAAGYYFGYVTSQVASAPAVSDVVTFIVTTGEEATHWQCFLAAQARIQLLGLVDVPADNVIIHKLPWDTGVDYGKDDTTLRGTRGGIILSMPLQETVADASVQRDDIGYPVMCTIFAADNRDLDVNQDKYLKWRQQIFKAFRKWHPPLVAAEQHDVWQVRVEPGPVVSQMSWMKNIFSSSLVLRFISREPRGL